MKIKSNLIVLAEACIVALATFVVGLAIMLAQKQLVNNSAQATPETVAQATREPLQTDVSEEKATKDQEKNEASEPQETIVVVEPGDTLSKIATAHDTTYVRLFNANADIKDPDVIFPGDEIRIPDPEEELKQRSLPAAPAPSKQISATAPTPRPKKQQVVAAAPTGSVWDRLAQCESSGNWSINTGNGYYGGLQFSLSSWQAVGGQGYPHQASKAEQINRAQKLQAIQGWGAWPACSAKLGLR